MTHDASFAQKGTVAWISHLGARAPRLSGFLLARGFPGNAPAEGLTRFLRCNVPAAIGFVAPHSLLPPRRAHVACKRLANDFERVGFGFGSFAARFLRRPGSGRLLYNAVSAGTLHFLLANFTPLTTPVVASLPLPEDAHVFLSVACLSLAVASMLAEPQTYGLLGTGQMLGWSPAFATPPPNHMDAITWMGVSAWRGGKQLLGERFLFARYVDAEKKAKHGDVLGATAFVLFTGVSILPKELTFGDCLTRGVAAFYLRRRSRSFRDWVASVEGAHLVTWGIRACLLFAAFRAATDHDVSAKSDGKMSPAAATACAAATAALLRFAERNKNKKSERRTRLTKKHVFETRDDAASVKSARKTEQPRESLRAFRDEGHDAPSVSVVEVSFRDIEPEGTKKTRRSARVSSRAA